MSLSNALGVRHKSIVKKLSTLKLTQEEKEKMAIEIDSFARLLIEAYKQRRDEI